MSAECHELSVAQRGDINQAITSVVNTNGGHIFHGNNFTGSVQINLTSPPNPRSEEEACLRALFQTDPRDYRGHLKTWKGHHVPGTCEYILGNDIYKSWLASPAQLLWLVGGPGQGKTVLSIFLVEVFEKAIEGTDNSIFLEYYCDSQDGDRNNAVAVIRGLILQLLNQKPNLYRFITPKFNMQGKALFANSAFESLWQILEDMICDPDTGIVYCILDGLDECDESSLEILLKKFRLLYSTANKRQAVHQLKLIAVSRDFPDCIPRLLHNFPCIHLAPKDDIRRFIDFKVDDLSTQNHYPGPLRKLVRDTFLSRAEDTFLWVGIVATLLEKCAPSEVAKALSEFPSGLNGLYTTIVRRISPHRREIAAKVLLWVSLASRPLSLSELGTALGTAAKPENGLSLADVTRDQVLFCGSFLTLKGSQVRLVHLSVRDYLTAVDLRQSRDLSLFFVDQVGGNLEIAKTCLDYIQKGAFAQGSVDLKSSNDYLRKYPLLEYAAIHWPDHARQLLKSEKVFNLSQSLFKPVSALRESWLKSYWSIKGNGELPTSFSLLHMACYLGVTPLVSKLLHKHLWPSSSLHVTAVNSPDSNGQTPLSHAASNGHTNVVELLLSKRRIAADWPDSNGNTPLYLTAEHGHFVVSSLLLARPDVNADYRNNSGFTPLLTASSGGYVQIVELLLQRREVSVNGKHDLGYTPLQWAAWMGHEQVVKLLLRNKDVTVNAQDHYGCTALSNAARDGHEAVVRILLSRRDVDPNIGDNYGNTPLGFAAAWCHESIVRLLLGRGDIQVGPKELKSAEQGFKYGGDGSGEIVNMLKARILELGAVEVVASVSR